MAYIPVTPKFIKRGQKHQLASIVELYPGQDNFVDLLTDDEQALGITENFKFSDFQQNLNIATTLQLGGIASMESEYNSKVFVKDAIAYRIKSNTGNPDSIVDKVYWGFGIRIIYKLYDFKAEANLDAKAIGFAIEAGMVKADTSITGLGLKRKAFATVLKELKPPKILNNDNLTALLYKLFVGDPQLQQPAINNDSFTANLREAQATELQTSVQGQAIASINQQLAARNYDLVPLGVELRETVWDQAQKSAWESIIKGMQFIANGKKYGEALIYAKANNYDKFSIEECYSKVVASFVGATTPAQRLEIKPLVGEQTKAANWLNLDIHDL